MNATKKVTQRGARLDRWAVWKTGDVHDAGHGLHGQVHGRVVFIGAAAAITRASTVHDARVDSAHLLVTHAQALHGAGGKVFYHHIATAHHFKQQLTPTGGLEVQGDKLFIGIEHGKGHRRATDDAASAQVLATRCLDFDHACTGHGQQKAAIRAVVDLTQIHHGHTIQRQRAAHFSAP